MGNNTSRSSSVNVVAIDTSTTIEKMTNTMVSTSQTTYQSSTNIQIAKIVIGKNGVVNGDAKINQKIDVTQQIQAQITQELVQNLQTQMINELSAKLDQEAKAQASFGGLAGQGQSASTKNITNIKNALKAVITDNVNVETIQKTQNDTFNLQTGDIVINGVVNGDVVINQNTIVNITSINILENVINLTNNYLSENKSNVQVKQKAKSKSGMTDAQTIGLIISCVISCLCCMLLVFMLPKILQSGGEAVAASKK